MGRFVLTAVIALASGTAMASSIEIMHGQRTSNGSILSMTCQTCPPVEKSEPSIVRTLTPGEQSVSIRHVDGRTETIRTEALLGGSPVTFVSTNPVWLQEQDGSKTADAPVIDRGAKTASVTAGPLQTAIVEDAAADALAGITSLPLRQGN